MCLFTFVRKQLRHEVTNLIIKNELLKIYILNVFIILKQEERIQVKIASYG